MKSFIPRLIVLTLVLTPLSLTVPSLPSWGQTQSVETTLQQLTQRAKTQTEQGLSQQAIDTWQKILDLARQHDKKSLQAFALVGLGLNYHKLQQPTIALEYYQQALPLARQTGDRRVVGAALNNMGASYQSLGQYQQALDHYQQALPITRQVDKLSDVAKTLNNIGEVYNLTGKITDALQYYQEALFIAQKSGNSVLERQIRTNISKASRN